MVLSDLLEPVKTSSSLAAVKKQLNRSEIEDEAVELPLHREETEWIHREVAFNKSSQILSKWDPVILKNRQAEQLVSPEQAPQSAFAPIEHVVSGCKAELPWSRRFLIFSVRTGSQ